MFPGAGAQIYRNEAGEPTGWDYPDQDGPYDEQYGDDGDLRDYWGDPDESDQGDNDEGEDDRLPAIFHEGGQHIVRTPDGWTGTYPTLHEAKRAIEERLDDQHDDPEPEEPDDAEVSWQEYGRAEHEADSYHDETACAEQHGDCACG